MLRPMGWGISFVHARLNHWRAITLCWIANRPNKSASIPRASMEKSPVPESMDLGTKRLPTNPIAFRHRNGLETHSRASEQSMLINAVTREVKIGPKRQLSGYATLIRHCNWGMCGNRDLVRPIHGNLDVGIG